MKINKPPVKQSVDSLALLYLAKQAEASQLEKEIAGLREQILAEGDSNNASNTGRDFYVTGKQYMLGKTEVWSSPSLDTEKLKLALTPGARALVFPKKTVVVEEFDEAVLVKLVEGGKIPDKTIKSATVPSHFKHNRILVSKLAK